MLNYQRNRLLRESCPPGSSPAAPAIHNSFIPGTYGAATVPRRLFVTVSSQPAGFTPEKNLFSGGMKANAQVPTDQKPDKPKSRLAHYAFAHRQNISLELPTIGKFIDELTDQVNA